MEDDPVLKMYEALAIVIEKEEEINKLGMENAQKEEFILRIKREKEEMMDKLRKVDAAKNENRTIPTETNLGPVWSAIKRLKAENRQQNEEIAALKKKNNELLGILALFEQSNRETEQKLQKQYNDDLQRLETRMESILRGTNAQLEQIRTRSRNYRETRNERATEEQKTEVKLRKNQTSEQEHERPADELQPFKARIALFERASQENTQQESIRRRWTTFPEEAQKAEDSTVQTHAARSSAVFVETERVSPPASPEPQPAYNDPLSDPVVVTALYDYEAQDEDELSFEKGDQIELLEKRENFVESGQKNKFR